MRIKYLKDSAFQRCSEGRVCEDISIMYSTSRDTTLRISWFYSCDVSIYKTYNRLQSRNDAVYRVFRVPVSLPEKMNTRPKYA